MQVSAWDDSDDGEEEHLTFEEFEQRATVDTNRKLQDLEDELFSMTNVEPLDESFSVQEEKQSAGQSKDATSGGGEAPWEEEENELKEETNDEVMDWRAWARQQEEAEEIPDVDNFRRQFIYLRVLGQKKEITKNHCHNSSAETKHSSTNTPVNRTMMQQPASSLNLPGSSTPPPKISFVRAADEDSEKDTSSNLIIQEFVQHSKDGRNDIRNECHGKEGQFEEDAMIIQHEDYRHSQLRMQREQAQKAQLVDAALVHLFKTVGCRLDMEFSGKTNVNNKRSANEF